MGYFEKAITKQCLKSDISNTEIYETYADDEFVTALLSQIN